jgi:hypothetical protein
MMSLRSVRRTLLLCIALFLAGLAGSIAYGQRLARQDAESRLDLGPSRDSR